ncbi:MAG TPA: 50S ribosomal protein L5 [Planctomycetes bacterium]|nr:50S ribosomal protein L5 [Planctomycetota bacterium]
MPQKPRLKVKYEEDIVPALKERLGLRNVMQVPRIEKVCISMGVGSARDEPALLEQGMAHLSRVAGQKAVVTKARKAISAFRIRRGFNVGCRVTLRKNKMYEFLDRLITVAIPRIRDFRGLNPKGFDGRGNFAFGVQEQLVFPEISPDQVTQTQGMNIVITTNAKEDKKGLELLKAFGFPFRKSAE